MTPEQYFTIAAAIIVAVLFIAGWVVLSVKFGPIPLFAAMPYVPQWVPPPPPMPPPLPLRLELSAWEQMNGVCPMCNGPAKR